MERQTAIQWLKKELEDYGSPSQLSLDWNTFDELCEQAKLIEKENLVDAWEDGACSEYPDHICKATMGEQYYNETYL